MNTVLIVGASLSGLMTGLALSRAGADVTPIAEYVPDRLVNGRLALVGDAAHVPTPMTGCGFSASLDDAEAIAGRAF